MNETNKTIRSLKKAGFIVEVEDFWKMIRIRHGAFTETFCEVSFNDLEIEKIGVAGCIERFMEEVAEDTRSRTMDMMSW